MSDSTPRTKQIPARRVTEFDHLVIDGTPHKVTAIESIDYGTRPEQTTIYAGMRIEHYWYDEKVTVVRD